MNNDNPNQGTRLGRMNAFKQRISFSVRAVITPSDAKDDILLPADMTHIETEMMDKMSPEVRREYLRTSMGIDKLEEILEDKDQGK
jgi:O-acetylhomoserine/O-acetylserine sulfhydrylase-like pyridoxal-dependent enzyme